MPETTDTRDRLIALEVEVRHLVDMVKRNSTILDELRELQQQAKGGFSLGRAALGVARGVGSGGVGAGLLWLGQHFAKVAI
jgi:hypothetical protein